jgi:hypothetical protein
VITWRTDLPYAFYFISEADAKTLANKIRSVAGSKGRFLITELAEHKQHGWLTPDSWYLIANKRLKPKS